MADIQSIFNKYGALCREKYGVTINQSKVMKAIETCRTSAIMPMFILAENVVMKSFPTTPVEIYTALNVKILKENCG